MKLTKTDRRKFRIRNKLKNVSRRDRYRLCVSRSSKNITAQIIDDIKKTTLISASSLDKEIRSKKIKKTEQSIIVAKMLAKKAQEKKINKIYFDKGIYSYHGRIKIFADTLRKNGMDF